MVLGGDEGVSLLVTKKEPRREGLFCFQQRLLFHCVSNYYTWNSLIIRIYKHRRSQSFISCGGVGPQSSK
jgi:hypothetical protein